MLTLHSPIKTPYHRMPVGMKLALLLICSVIILQVPNGWPVGGALGITALLYAAGGWGFMRLGLRLLRPIVPFVVIVILWDWAYGQIEHGLMTAMRLTALVAIANLVTMTSKLSDMLAVFETLARPFAWILPPRRLALAFALVIRFIPTLGDTIASLNEAWRARSPRRPFWRLIIPALLAAIDTAEHTAQALRARGGSD